MRQKATAETTQFSWPSPMDFSTKKKKECFGLAAVTWGSVCPAKSFPHSASCETHRRSWSVPHRHTEGRLARTDTQWAATRGTQVWVLTVPIQHWISAPLLTKLPVPSAWDAVGAVEVTWRRMFGCKPAVVSLLVCLSLSGGEQGWLKVTECSSLLHMTFRALLWS